MNFARQYRELVSTVLSRISIPAVSGIHLPRPVDEELKADEFGFVFLEDGTAAPFYTSLDDALERLWQMYPDGRTCQADIRTLVESLDSQDAGLNALAIGAFNAMSQHVMARAGFLPLSNDHSSSKSSIPPAQIAMVGFFRPMIAGLLEQGHNLMVLEKNPAKVEIQAGVQLMTDPSELLKCDHVLCTASTLINGTLAGLLQFKKPSAHFSLIGPSGSGLPDILFANGVDDVGGIYIRDLPALKASLELQESWGHAGQKYQISQQHYPGFSQLLDTILDKEQ